MKAVVLGAGIVGVTTAYELAKDGHDVTVIDRCEGPGLETSYANGGQLSWDHAAPIGSVPVVLKALTWLGRRDAPLLFRMRADPALWSWTLRFLANCPDAKFWRTAERIMRVALYARERMQYIVKAEKIAFDHRKGGILALFQNAKDFDREVDQLRSWRELDCSRAALDRKGCIEMEPSLAHSTFLITGAIHTPHDESGDCYEFTRQLAERCKSLGVHFRWNTTVTSLQRDGWHVTQAVTDGGDGGDAVESGDVFVMALGSYSPLLMKGLDLDLPIYPAKGYSVTVPIVDDTMAPAVSITSQAHKVVFTRLGNHLRIAGMLEFGGYENALDMGRAQTLLDNAQKLFPRAFDAEHATFWTGLRPLTPDSGPIIGRAKQHNLILNTGHGMYGWTMAAGTARLAADLAKGNVPEIDMDGLGWERFA